MKIRIIGPVGSGKTTLAHQISARTGLTVTSLDELNWERLTQGDRHRVTSERQAVMAMLTPYAEKTIILKSFDKINRLE